MLTNSSLIFIAFINLFLIPIIGSKIYCRRHNIKWSCSLDLLHIYALITVLNLPLTRVFLIIIEKITSIIFYIEESKYTIIAFISCVILAFIMEIIEKFFHVEVTIFSRNSSKGKKTNTRNTEEKNEK